MTSALDKLSSSLKDVQVWMESVRNAGTIAQGQISLLESRLAWGQDGGGSGDATTTGGKEKSKMMELQSALNDLKKVRIPELEMSLQQANLDKARLKLDKVGLDAALTESKRALTNTEATVTELRQQLEDCQVQAGRMLKQAKEEADKTHLEEMTRLELRHDQRVSELEEEAKKRVSELEEETSKVRQRYEKQLLNQEERNIDLTMTIKEKTEMIEKFSNTVKERDDIIRNQETKVKERDEFIRNQESKIKELTDQIMYNQQCMTQSTHNQSDQNQSSMDDSHTKQEHQHPRSPYASGSTTLETPAPKRQSRRQALVANISGAPSQRRSNEKETSGYSSVCRVETAGNQDEGFRTPKGLRQRHPNLSMEERTPVSGSKRKNVSFSNDTVDNEGKTPKAPRRKQKSPKPPGDQDERDREVGNTEDKTAPPPSTPFAKRPLFDFDHFK